MKHSRLMQATTYAGIPNLPLGILSHCFLRENSRRVLRQYDNDYLNKKLPHEEAVENARQLSLRLRAEEEASGITEYEK